MPAYCTDGQVRRAWPFLSASADFDALADIRERVMGEIDAALACAFQVPFSPWLHVTGVASNDLTVSFDDVGFLSVGDTIAFYDESTKKMGTTTTTVASITDTTVTVASAGSIAVNDEIAVVTSVDTPGGRTVQFAGPPREVAMVSIPLACYYAHADLTDFEEVPPALAMKFERALAWLERAAENKVHILGTTSRTPGFHSHDGHTPVFGPDDPSNWAVDSDLLDDWANARD